MVERKTHFLHNDVTGSPEAEHNFEQTHANAIEELRKAKNFLLYIPREIEDNGCEVLEIGVVNKLFFLPVAAKLAEDSNGMANAAIQKAFLRMLFGREGEIGDS